MMGMQPAGGGPMPGPQVDPMPSHWAEVTVGEMVEVIGDAVVGGGIVGEAVGGGPPPRHMTVKETSPAAVPRAAWLLYHVVLIAITSPGAVAIVTSSLYSPLEPLVPHRVEIPELSSYLRCQQGAMLVMRWDMLQPPRPSLPPTP